MLASFTVAFIQVTFIFVVICYSFPMKKPWQRGLFRAIGLVIALSCNFGLGVSGAYMSGFFMPFIFLPMSVIYFALIRPKLKKRYRVADGNSPQKQ